MPIVVTLAAVKHSGGGALRYLVAAPSAVVISILVVYMDWTLGRAIWLRSQQYPKRIQKGVGVALFGFQLLSILVGTVSGVKLAAFVVNHLAI